MIVHSDTHTVMINDKHILKLLVWNLDWICFSFQLAVQQYLGDLPKPRES